ncbi:hypothetical protein ACQEVF_57465 [Nonomuraea polychroma]|uniref:hypothetical protein n=1 Tax=Nonomuraea polychroma TaxID=46176 RepID=UPI003D91BAC4
MTGAGAVAVGGYALGLPAVLVATTAVVLAAIGIYRYRTRHRRAASQDAARNSRRRRGPDAPASA